MARIYIWLWLFCLASCNPNSDGANNHISKELNGQIRQYILERNLSKEQVYLKARFGDKLPGLNLTGLDLSGVDLSEMDLSEANFARVSLH